MSGARGDAKNVPYPAISGAECKLNAMVSLELTSLRACFGIHL
jgi:hypothetical protein